MMRPARDAGQPRVRNRMVCQPQFIGGMCVAVQRKYTSGFFRRDREAKPGWSNWCAGLCAEMKRGRQDAGPFETPVAS